MSHSPTDDNPITQPLSEQGLPALQPYPGVLLIEPQLAGLLPAVILRMDLPELNGRSDPAALESWFARYLAGVRPARPMLILTGAAADSSAEQAFLAEFLENQDQGIYLKLTREAPAHLPDGIALVAEGLAQRPLGNLIKWFQRLQVSAWVRCQDTLEPEVNAAAERGFVSAHVLLSAQPEVGPEIARLLAGPCPPSGFEAFEFRTVRQLVRPEGEFNLKLQPEDSMRSQPLGRLLASSDLEQWVVEQEGDRALLLDSAPKVGGVAGLIVRAVLPHARLAVDQEA